MGRREVWITIALAFIVANPFGAAPSPFDPALDGTVTVRSWFVNLMESERETHAFIPKWQFLYSNLPLVAVEGVHVSPIRLSFVSCHF